MVNTSRIFLIGMMGSGKSTVSRELAMLIGFDPFDTDDELSKKYGPIESIFAEQGEETFRKMEAELLDQVLLKNRVVVATGGGLPVHHGNMDKLLTTGKVVFLDTSIPVLLSRLKGETSQRPLLNEVPELILQRLDSARRATYERAHYKVVTDETKPADVALAILHQLKNANR